MDTDRETEEYVLTDEEVHLLGTGVDRIPFSEGMVIVDAYRKAYERLTDALNLSGDFLGPRLLAERQNIRFKLDILDGVIRVIGEEAEGTQLIEEIEAFRKGLAE